MLIIKILLGLVGLGVVVFVHELGHFIAARLVGIDVEAFSIGWGRPILAKKIGGVEYRLGIFPIGGYCKMRGENEFEEAWKNSRGEVKPEKGSFFEVSPAARILVAAAGPLFNLLFAVLVFAFTWGIGFEYTTMSNRVVLVSDIFPEEDYPATRAGIKTGDRIIEINGKTVENYRDIQTLIAVNAEKELHFKILREYTPAGAGADASDGAAGAQSETVDLYISPEMEKSSGAGRIGVYFWADPVIESVLPDSPAAEVGLESGDRVIAVNGEPFAYSVAMLKIVDGEGTRPKSLNIEINRGGQIINTQLAVPPDDSMPIGIAWQLLRYHTPRYSVFGAVGKGFSEMWDTLVISVRSLALLFRGVDLTKAVSGPVRVSYMAGEVAANSFGQSAGEGLRSTANFLALISIALAVMNLLPLPILDGGLIVLFLIEMIRRRPLNPRFISVYQTAGIVLIGALMLFAVFGDILFFVQG
ncbi:MAG: RIP metalloprotease RseP [Spirochaetaceae bacterium]|jgi:regulator of sigma E protease|nr:RIP metalloprotease RseP [Spirochaetaceae bacterium]